ncbi:cell division protein SepF [Streptomyces albipurpureus]|uniref:Cell division protein SepF n=1 Tax=Streptomyces albipurpureus TaxID=2897419 RepID=A0ABT0UNS4_9ACTN|nr:cell division protein SepF [Streptomyces sp. CWNU-1]MCM2390262.1 cell division protein SepF [Streptomyces sp. CWNU-1]
MGSVRKASAWLGLVEDNDERYYGDDYAEYAEGAETGEAWVTDPELRTPSDSAQEEESRRIATVSPSCFRDARGIGELFRDGVPVIVNLTSLESPDAKRVVDFCAGLTFGLKGSIERVATRVFLLSPAHTQVVNAEAPGRTPDGFYNQS